MSDTSTQLDPHPTPPSAPSHRPRSIERPGTEAPVVAVALTAVVLTGAIFGFFYAWVCSTMWGLDDADPRVAVEAMQAMNASVRNAVFFPAFFLTPLVLAAASVLLRRSDRRTAARWFGAAAATYLVGGLVLTMAVNVPMNEDLARQIGPLTEAAAARIWGDYSGSWQLWNAARTIASGTALAFAANGLRFLSRPSRPSETTDHAGTRARSSTTEAASRPGPAPDVRPADRCSDMHEIRNEIDRLDRTIIRLLGDRLTYVHAAAAFKTSDASVRALDRVETMLADRERWAAEHGLDPVAVRALYEELIDYFTGLEFDAWNDRH